MRLCGISSRFQLLSPCVRQVTHALLTRPPLSHRTIIPEGNQVKCFVRLACVKHAASVHPEPGSNSHKKFFPFQNQLANFNHSLIPNQKLTFLFSRYSSNLTASSSIFLITREYCFRLLWLSSLLFSRTHLNRELLRCSQWIFQGYFTVQLSKFFVCCRSATFISYQMFKCLSTTFFLFPEVFSRSAVASHAACVLTFLLSVPPHQRQLAYNSTAHGRSQYISAGFAEVGHLALFSVIVWIVLIICTILSHTTCT